MLIPTTKIWKHTIITLLIVAGASNLAAQSQSYGNGIGVLKTGDRPRAKEQYNKPGHYEMVAFPDKIEISPGDSFKINIYFTGYGQIGPSKVFVCVNKDIFESDATYALGGLTKTKDSMIYWGAIKQSFPTNNTIVIPLEGISNTKSKDWGGPTNYIDFSPHPYVLSILTEFAIRGVAPYSYHLKTIDSAEPGYYTITLAYTYYNGEAWSGQQQTMTIKVQNIIERNPGWAWLIGIVTLVIAFVGLLPILREITRRIVNPLFKTKSLPPNPTAGADSS